MPFFARPDLSDEQFKQLVGSQLSLSGQTRIVTTSGLTLTDGSGGYIPIIATGATPYSVLTYVGGEITLKQMSGGSGGGYYSGLTPTTRTVGGLNAGSPIGGQSISSILQSILVPTLSATTTLPSISSFSLAITPISVPSLLREIGSTITVTGTTLFSRGTVSPQYCGTSPYRSGLPVNYEYCYAGVSAGVCVTASPYPFTPKVVGIGGNSFGSRVFYASGDTPIYDSAGNVSCATLASGNTTYSSISVTGIYPYYYGKVASGGAAAGVNRPAATAALITGGTKVVLDSTGTLSIPSFGSTSDDYIWFAIPNASTSKTKWCVDALNNGNIGGVVSAGGNLFPASSIVSGVANTFWSGQSYKLYISNYQTASSIMYLKNS